MFDREKYEAKLKRNPKDKSLPKNQMNGKAIRQQLKEGRSSEPGKR
jgi:hypothetical protein